MAVVRSGASSADWTIDTVSLAGRVTLYDSAGVAVPTAQGRATYVASNTFTPIATPTDMLWVGGSASKTVRVVSFKITTTNTAAGSQQFFLVKRSTADTAGTPTTTAGTPLDSADAAATAVVTHYAAGANPTLGTAVGTIATARVASPVATPATFAGIVQDAGYDLLAPVTSAAGVGSRQVILRGVAQQLCLNFNGAALVAGQTHAFQIVWTEE